MPVQSVARNRTSFIVVIIPSNGVARVLNDVMAVYGDVYYRGYQCDLAGILFLYPVSNQT